MLAKAEKSVLGAKPDMLAVQEAAKQKIMKLLESQIQNKKKSQPCLTSPLVILKESDFKGFPAVCHS